MPKSILKKASPKRQIEKPNTLQKSTPRQIAKLRQVGALARVPVDAFASPESHVMKVEPETLGFVAESAFFLNTFGDSTRP